MDPVSLGCLGTLIALAGNALSSVAEAGVEAAVDALSDSAGDVAEAAQSASIEGEVAFGDSWTDPVDDGNGIYDSYNTRYESYSEFVEGVNGRSTYEV